MSKQSIPIEPYIEKLVQAILIGATYELAALYAGISYKTFLRWRQRAETAREGTPLAILRDRLSQAEGQAAVRWLAIIEKEAQNGDWKAAAWKLQHRYPSEYGRTVQEHTGEDGKPMVIRVEYEKGMSGLLRQAKDFTTERDSA